MHTTTETTAEFRAYDVTTGQMVGPVRQSLASALRDANAHNKGCRAQRGYGSAMVIAPHRDGSGTAVYANSRRDVYPPHGATSGAVRFAPESKRYAFVVYAISIKTAPSDHWHCPRGWSPYYELAVAQHALASASALWMSARIITETEKRRLTQDEADSLRSLGATLAEI